MAEITLWDPVRHCLVSRGSLDAEAYHAEAGIIYHLSEGYSGWLVRHRQPLLIPDIAARRDVRPKLDRPDFPFRSYLGVPLSGPEGFIGTLEVISYRPAAFSERDLLLLQRIGEHAATAIEHARLYEETRRRALELSTLARVATTVSSTLNLHQVLETIASAVLEVTGCDASALFVLDEEARVLRLAATRGLSPDYVRLSQTLPLEIGGRGHAAAVGHPVIVAGLNADPAMRRIAPLAQEEGFVAFADIPMRIGERIIGMLVAFFSQPHYFTESEKDLLTTFADQAAIAIENARLYARTEHHLRQQQNALQGLQRVAQELSQTFDQEYILRLVLEESVRIARAPRGAILLRDESSGAWNLLLCTGYLEEEQAVLRQRLRYPEEEEVLMDLEQTARSVYLPDVTPANVVLGQREVRSAFLAPIRLGEALVGAIALFGHQPDAFGPEVRQFVEALASQAAIAMGNARWHQEQQERASFLHRRTDQAQPGAGGEPGLPLRPSSGGGPGGDRLRGSGKRRLQQSASQRPGGRPALPSSGRGGGHPPPCLGTTETGPTALEDRGSDPGQPLPHRPELLHPRRGTGPLARTAGCLRGTSGDSAPSARSLAPSGSADRSADWPQRTDSGHPLGGRAAGRQSARLPDHRSAGDFCRSGRNSHRKCPPSGRSSAPSGRPGHVQ